MMDVINDDDRPELEPPVLQGLAQAVPRLEPRPELRARTLSAALSRGAPARPRPTLWWLATAASLAFAVGIGLYSAQLRSRIITLEGELRDTRAQVKAASGLIAVAQSAAADAQAAVGVLAAADLARIELDGQPAAPQAAARAFWSRSRGTLLFAASNLPPLPEGRIYQLWVVTDRAPISAGLLTPDAQGSVNATLRTAPDIPQPVAMAVTIEPAGGVPAPTGDRYLVGIL